MKKLCLLIGFLLTATLSFAQEDIEYKEYTYKEFLDLLQAERDTIFQLKNALIKYTHSTDSVLFGHYVDNRPEGYSGVIQPKAYRVDTIEIEKRVELDNVHFTAFQRSGQVGVLSYLKFLRKVRIENSTSIILWNCSFEKGLVISNLKENTLPATIKNQLTGYTLNVADSKVKGTFFVRIDPIVDQNGIGIDGNVFEDDLDEPFSRLYISINNAEYFDFSKNEIKNRDANFDLESIKNLKFGKNHFRDFTTIRFPNEIGESRSISQNQFDKVIALSLGQLNTLFSITWPQFEKKIVNGQSFIRSMVQLQTNDSSVYKPLTNDLSPDNIAYYQNQMIIQDELVYKEEVKLLGQFYEFYQSQHDRSYANSVFLKIKDLETARLEYLYNKTPTFETFFTWKINQFLSVFSAHGTKPAKAIIFSMYVIIAFALIYLFFPNSWDAHGKNRIVDRYRFFFKYLQRNTGVHEVYLEEKQQDLLDYEEFKAMISNSQKSVPQFFSATALPLYQWAVSGTRLTAKILSKIDVLKGTWEDLPTGQKAWKSFLLVGAFMLALVYDLLIKVLNALMLSINTFTTLGFGEIPIKGLPRYLAIIQGFIGWFMLTIFSVSLISQLLN